MKTNMNPKNATTLIKYVESHIGLQGSRQMRNVAGWTDEERARLPEGTPTTCCYGGAALMPVMSMPIAEVLSQGFGLRNIVAAVRRTSRSDPRIVIERGAGFGVDLTDIRPTDTLRIHHTHIG